ncbi:MAG: MBL fold metallo-hydrolase [Candidatus Aminicenantes bacterium]|nr:MBL fold metallo-hydrolase [Candidatus Aminicenantes bacterium]
MRKTTIGFLLLCAAALISIGSPSGSSQVFNYFEGGRKPDLEIVKMGGGLYLAKGEWGANVGFFVGDDGVFVIDSKTTAGATRKVVKEIRKITSKPITKVAFTHSDSDCFNGYDVYPATAEIICSLRSRQELAKGLWTFLEMNAPSDIYSSGPTSMPMPDFLPAVSFGGQLNLWFGSETIELFQYGSAHTSGDVVIRFPARGVAFIGDLVFVHHDPLIQRHKGGYSFGLVTTLSILLKAQPEIRTFIPSHADPIDRDELGAIVRSIEEIQAKVLAMVDEGKTLDDVKKAFQISEAPKAAGNWVWPRLAETVYQELTERRMPEKMPTIERRDR